MAEGLPAAADAPVVVADGNSCTENYSMNTQTHSSVASIVRSRCLLAVGAIPLALALLVAQGCSSKVSQEGFDSADKAVEALVAAARAQDTDQLKTVLGPGSEDVLSSGDKVADENLLETFLKAYDEKHQLVAGKDTAMTLEIGKTDWPMPIPLVQVGGRWRFDTEAGKEEILNRRIGRNELDAVQSCLAVLDAQREYVSKDRDANELCEYAGRFLSEPGKKNGLYWPTAEGEPLSPLGPFAAEAAAEGYSTSQPTAGPRPYHGYCFRILTSQGANAPGGAMDYMVGGKLIGGFAVVAWPADYDNSGVTTFIMNHEGKVYQCDLGEDTAKIAAAITAYDPGPEWKKVESDK